MNAPRNVLILKSDEHNPRMMSADGHPGVETPNIDRLAQGGVVFENAYCPSPLCCPSRSSFLSCRPVHEIQCYNNSMTVERPNFPSYGKVLDAAGVHSVHVGKVDAYRPVAELGFTEMMGQGYRGDGDTFISRDPLAIRPDMQSRADGVGVREAPFRVDERRVRDALAFLDRSGELTVPWTMEVDLNAPHFPHYVTQDLWDRYEGRSDLPEYGTEAESAHHPYAADLRRHFSTHVFTEDLTRAHRRAYYGRVTWVDAQLGLLLDKLEDTGQLADTVVVYTSDHGEMLGLYGMWFKSSMYEDSVRVPLVVSGPGFGTGGRVTTPVTQWDLCASVFSSVGVDAPDHLPGFSLAAVPDDDGERAVFSEYHGHGTRGSAYMVRQGGWKLIYNARAPHQLYDLEADPRESRNLARDAAPTVRKLTDRLHDEFCDPEDEQDRAERFIAEQLAALG